MKVSKKVLAKLNKCYATTIITLDGKQYILSAAEKDDPCLMFDMEGNQVDTLWESDGGVMTLRQAPGFVDEFLATNRFYSPNNSADARIVRVFKKDGAWVRENIKDLPFVHRFGVIENKENRFLIACTLKSAHAFKDDWTCPGRVWVCKLPEDFSTFNDNNQLEMTPIISGLYKNHGYVEVKETDVTYALVGTDNGVYKIVPPSSGEEFEITKLLSVPTSDMLYVDFDGDGIKELLIYRDFHGSTLEYYRFENGEYKLVQEFEQMPFLHAIWHSKVNDKDYAFLGNRQGLRELFVLSYDADSKKLVKEVLDSDVGPTNCMVFNHSNKQFIFSNNRETDEVALYEILGE